MTDVPDWAYSRVRSRAVDTERTNQGEPTPVIATTESGEHPHGDGTRWGSTVTERVSIPVGIEGFQVTSGQIVRAQVADHYARRWRWILEVSLEAPIGALDLTVDAIWIEWTMGTGQSVMVRKLDLLALVAPLSFIVGWLAPITATTASFLFHDIGALTNPIGEAIAARMILFFTNTGDAPVEVITTYTLFLAPEALASQ